MAFEKGNRPDSPMKRRGGRRRKKVCVFCGKENNEIDYKDTAKLKKYVSERGKILPASEVHPCLLSEEELFPLYQVWLLPRNHNPSAQVRILSAFP